MSIVKEQIYRQIFKALSRAEKILIATHEKPDGDAIGSLLSFYYFLEKNSEGEVKKQLVKLFIPDQTLPVDFNFLPHYDKIENDNLIFRQHQFDVFLILDSGDLCRSGLKEFPEGLSYKPALINIDHHALKDNFCHYNLVDTGAASTTEIIYDFLKFIKVGLEPRLALALLLGIITDTDFFANPNTQSQSFKAASELVKKGAKINLILDKIYKRPTIKGLKLWGKALARLNVDTQNGLAKTAIFKDDLDVSNVNEDDLLGLANFLNKLSDVKGALVLKEDDFGYVKGSLRTTRDDVDILTLAREFGGGGHAKAAAFKVKGRIVGNAEEGWGVEKIGE